MLKSLPTPITALRAGAALALTLCLAACASGPPSGFEDGPGDGPGPRGSLNLFISPAGQPLRAPAGAAYPSATWFAAADANHDGRLSLDEFLADADAFFRTLDTNHDGVVDGFETQDYEKSIPELQPRVGGLRPGEGMDPTLGRRGGGNAPRADRARQGGSTGRRGAGPFSFLNDPQPVTAADANFDSRITPAEFRAVAERRFRLLDTDGDGFLILATLPKPPVQVFAENATAKAGRRNQPPPGVEPGSRPPRP